DEIDGTAVVRRHRHELVAEDDSIVSSDPFPASGLPGALLDDNFERRREHPPLCFAGEAVREPRRLRHAILRGAPQHPALRRFETDPMADRDKDRAYSLLRPEHRSNDLAIVDEVSARSARAGDGACFADQP